MPVKKVSRVKKKSLTEESMLSPGDLITYHLTSEVKDGSVSMWVKLGATTTIRADEKAASAQRRLQRFVENAVNRKVDEIVGS